MVPSVQIKQKIHRRPKRSYETLRDISSALPPRALAGSPAMWRLLGAPDLLEPLVSGEAGTEDEDVSSRFREVVDMS